MQVEVSLVLWDAQVAVDETVEQDLLDLWWYQGGYD